MTDLYGDPLEKNYTWIEANKAYGDLTAIPKPTAHPKIFRVTVMHEGVEVEYVQKSERDELLAALKEAHRLLPSLIHTSADIDAVELGDAIERARAALARAEGR